MTCLTVRGAGVDLRFEEWGPAYFAIAHEAQGRIEVGLVRCGYGGGAALLIRDQHRIEHQRDGALLGERQRLDQFELLLQLWRRPALARAGLFAHQILDFHTQGLGHQRQGWRLSVRHAGG